MDEPDKSPAKQKLPAISSERVSIEFSNRIAEFINDKSASETDACPVCSSHFNTVNQLVFGIEARPATGSDLPDQHMPFYVTMCHNCGFTRLFNKILVDRKIAAEDVAKIDAENQDGGSDGS